MVAEVDGACHVGNGTGGALAVTVDDLLDGGIAHAGMSIGAGGVLHIGSLDDTEVGAVRAFVRRHDLVDIPAVVGARASAIGPVLQRIAGTAQFVVGAGLVPDVEAGLVVDCDLLDLQIRDVLGVVGTPSGGDEAVTHVGDVVEKIPGGVAWIDFGADGAQVERPAIADVSAWRGAAVAFVGPGAGIGEGELRGEAAGAGAAP